MWPPVDLMIAKPAGKDLVPTVTLAVEHYNRMVQILDKKIPVKVELHVQTQFYDESEPNGFNVIADLPGGELSNEIVLLGAHLDSHQSATGATDNAAGSAVMMDAMRIPKAVGVRPRRTIRVALWRGEEEGLLGSRAYVRDHLADVTTKAVKPEHQNLSAYYNLDNGTGRIRGVWLQDNLAVAPIFRTWFQPLRDLDVLGAIAPRSVSGSDYTSFDAVGIPAFQFMQDRLEYNSRMHHSNMDTVDRVQRDDVVQAAIVVAAFAYNTAMRPEKLPRKAGPYARDHHWRLLPAACRISCRCNPSFSPRRAASPNGWADFDNDCDLDLFVGFKADLPNRLYRNDGGKFTEMAGDLKLADLPDTRAAAWGDFNGDGQLDLYVGFTRRSGVPNKLYRNEGDGKRFIDVAKEMGVDVKGETRQIS